MPCLGHRPSYSDLEEQIRALENPVAVLRGKGAAAEEADERRENDAALIAAQKEVIADLTYRSERATMLLDGARSQATRWCIEREQAYEEIRKLKNRLWDAHGQTLALARAFAVPE